MGQGMSRGVEAVVVEVTVVVMSSMRGMLSGSLSMGDLLSLSVSMGGFAIGGGCAASCRGSRDHCCGAESLHALLHDLLQ